MLKIRVGLILLMVVSGNAWAVDEFAAIKCGADIRTSLIGKRDSSEPVAAIEKRHQDLGLKNVGGTEISDGLFLASWRICGSEYELLVDTRTGLIRDVLPFPTHSASSPMSIGACESSGKKLPGTILAVLNNSAGLNAKDEKHAGTLLKATAAWRIDEAKEKFARQPAENLGCPVAEIVTQDGGR
jgi:hypothetical protein